MNIANKTERNKRLPVNILNFQQTYNIIFRKFIVPQKKRNIRK